MLKQNFLTFFSSLVLISLTACLTCNCTDSSNNNHAATIAAIVSDMPWESPIGEATYTGEFAVDHGVKIPNGQGIFEVTEGKYKGNVYNGTLVNGIMEGEATYTLSNGDTYKGTFRNNHYHQGRYTIKASGEYFEGIYKDDAPYKGYWYDKNGNKIE